MHHNHHENLNEKQLYPHLLSPPDSGMPPLEKWTRSSERAHQFGRTPFVIPPTENYWFTLEVFSPQTLRNLFPHFRRSSPECHFTIETSPMILHRLALPTPLPPLLCFIFLHSMENHLTCSFYPLSLPQVLRKYLLNEQKNEKLYKLNPG